MDKIAEKFDLVASSMLALKKSGKTTTTVNFMGGELLADDLPDSLFSEYETLIKRVRDYGISIDFLTEMHISTNLVWENTNRVKDFLDRVGIQIAVSYDPAGRFNTENFEIFKKNLVEFKPYVKFVGSVMTKPSIDRFMARSVPFFDYIYNNFDITFDHYTPEGGDLFPDPNLKTSNFLMPADVELREFYKFMLDNWPNCQPFKDMPEKSPQPLSCMSTITIRQNANIDSCTKYDITTAAPAQQVVTFFGNLSKHKDQWLEDYNCLSCEHMQYCTFGCFMNNHTKKIRTQEECWLKEVYNYVDEKNKNSLC
jgi:radical SAM protein with 4Fe4S-binding SPASM domain